MAQEKYLGENGLKRLVGLVKEDLGTKANIDGSYDGMQVGSAKQIVSPTGITDTTPYIFRTTCGETSISGGDEQLASLKAIRGNTIAWNQLVKNGDFQDSSNWNKPSILTIENNIATITCDQDAYGQGIEQNTEHRVIKGHKYYFSARAKSNQIDGAVRATQYAYGNGVSTLNFGNLSIGISFGQVSGFAEATENSSGLTQWRFACIRTNGASKTGDVLEITNINIIDLTQMFGPGNEPTSVLEFTRLFPKLYYPFNAGEIRNVKIKGLKTVGYNAFDGELRKGYYNNGNYISLNNSVCNVNPIKVVPCQTYTLERSITFIPSVDEMAIAEYDENMNFIKKTGVNTETNKLTLTSNTHYCNWWIYKSGIGATVPTQEQAQICFHLAWSESRTGYATHEEHILHIDTARYFPDGMNGFGTAYDELTPKQAIKRFEEGDFGTLNYAKVKMNGGYGFYCGLPTSKKVDVEVIANIISPNFETISYGSIYNKTTGKFIARQSDGQNIVIFDDSKQNLTESEFKTAMSGIPFIYELAEPIVTEIPQVRDNHWEIKVDDYGTEEWLFPEGDEIPVPVGHETLYMDNLVDKLRNLPDPNDYKALESELQTWVKLPPLPTDTTKVYVPKFVNGTIQWVEE